MSRTFLLSTLAATLIAAGGLALAQTPAPTPAPSRAQAAPMAGHHAMQGAWGQRGMHRRMGRHGGPAGAVIGDLRQLSRLYIMQGRPDQLEGLYKDVLARTQNPMVRNVAYRALARLQARPRDTGAAIATLRKSLDENLDRLNAMPARGQGGRPGRKP